MSPVPSLSLGPVNYHWGREVLLDFYRQVEGWPVEIVYLGEVVCAKRRALRTTQWLDVADRLRASGKEVCLSTLTLIGAASELSTLRRLCRNRDYMIEANDMAAVYNLHQRGMPFVSGPTINIYNARSLDRLVSLGLTRWTLPAEIGEREFRDIRSSSSSQPAAEVVAWGRMGLSWSARCFSARAHQRDKDDCGFVCSADPDGRLVRTRDDAPFLALNGTQTQSALTQNLAPSMKSMCESGIDVLRIYPQSGQTGDVVAHFDRLRRGIGSDDDVNALEMLAPVGCCDGFWHGRAGFTRVAPREWM